MLDDKQENKILRQFKKFCKFGFNRKFFTRDIYNYLHLECAFIAHFNIENFYLIYFTNLQGFVKFREYFEKLYFKENERFHKTLLNVLKKELKE